MQGFELFGKRQLREIGRRVRIEREMAGLTQLHVAEAAGMSIRAVRDLEAGRSSPSLSTMVAITDVLSLSLDDLIAAARKAKLPVDLTAKAETANGVTYLTRSLENPKLRASIVNLAGRESGPDLPAGALFGHVIEGEVAIRMAGETAHLRRGDSLHARTGILEAFKAEANGACILLVEADDRPETATGSPR